MELRNLIDQEFEKGTFQLDLSPFHCHTVASILKTFFRELAEPLFPASIYSSFFDATQQENNILKIDLMKRIISAVPLINRQIFQILSEFLLLVAREPLNKMTTGSLAIVFGPNLLRPDQQTVETTLNTPQINLGFQFIWDHFDQFRPILEK